MKSLVRAKGVKTEPNNLAKSSATGSSSEITDHHKNIQSIEAIIAIGRCRKKSRPTRSGKTAKVLRSPTPTTASRCPLIAVANLQGN